MPDNYSGGVQIRSSPLSLLQSLEKASPILDQCYFNSALEIRK